jgi:hypothetical protein
VEIFGRVPGALVLDERRPVSSAGPEADKKQQDRNHCRCLIEKMRGFVLALMGRNKADRGLFGTMCLHRWIPSYKTAIKK